MTKMTKRGSKRVAFRIKIAQDKSMVSLPFAEFFSSMNATTSRSFGWGWGTSIAEPSPTSRDLVMGWVYMLLNLKVVIL